MFEEEGNDFHRTRPLFKTVRCFADQVRWITLEDSSYVLEMRRNLDQDILAAIILRTLKITLPDRHAARANLLISD